MRQESLQALGPRFLQRHPNQNGTRTVLAMVLAMALNLALVKMLGALWGTDPEMQEQASLHFCQHASHNLVPIQLR
jgi:hypothetical protein